jgi:hypothetical protein
LHTASIVCGVSRLACSLNTYCSVPKQKRQRDDLPKNQLRHIRFSKDE